MASAYHRRCYDQLPPPIPPPPSEQLAVNVPLLHLGPDAQWCREAQDRAPVEPRKLQLQLQREAWHDVDRWGLGLQRERHRYPAEAVISAAAEARMRATKREEVRIEYWKLEVRGYWTESAGLIIRSIFFSPYLSCRHDLMEKMDVAPLLHCSPEGRNT